MLGRASYAFVDGPALYRAARSEDWDVDYRRLLGRLRQQDRDVRAVYVTPVKDEFLLLAPLIGWLVRIGWVAIVAPDEAAASTLLADAVGRAVHDQDAVVIVGQRIVIRRPECDVLPLSAWRRDIERQGGTP